MMICQYCRTEQYEAVILDDDYRCRRCGRRMRNTPSRPASGGFPMHATATARAYEIEYNLEQPCSGIEQASKPDVSFKEETRKQEQQALFESTVVDRRVIPFDLLTTRSEREAIRSRVAGVSRPSPLRTERVQLKHARPTKERSGAGDQRRLEFENQESILGQSCASIICDAPVAPTSLRIRASLIDAFIVAIPCSLSLSLFYFVGGFAVGGRLLAPLVFAGLATVPLLYRLLWAIAGADSFGMQQVGLQLVDFDGNPPTRVRRYQRILGEVLSLSAAGFGLIWSLLDEDRLTWHDHISGTFPTFD